MYRARNKGMQILLSNSQSVPGPKVKQEQEEISRNHVQTFIYKSVVLVGLETPRGRGFLLPSFLQVLRAANTLMFFRLPLPF